MWYNTKLYIFAWYFLCVGVVTALLGIPVSQVMLGHSHTCVLTQLGTVYTFGGNNYGQCGRDYQPPEEEKKQGKTSRNFVIFLIRNTWSNDDN